GAGNRVWFPEMIEELRAVIRNLLRVGLSKTRVKVVVAQVVGRIIRPVPVLISVSNMVFRQSANGGVRIGQQQMKCADTLIGSVFSQGVNGAITGLAGNRTGCRPQNAESRISTKRRLVRDGSAAAR